MKIVFEKEIQGPRSNKLITLGKPSHGLVPLVALLVLAFGCRNDSIITPIPDDDTIIDDAGHNGYVDDDDTGDPETEICNGEDDDGDEDVPDLVENFEDVSKS